MNALTIFPLLVPLVLVITGALVTLVCEPFIKTDAKHSLLPWIAAIFIVAAGIAQALVPTGHLHGLFAMDTARLWLCEAVLVATLCSIAGAQSSLGRDRFAGGEAYPLMLVAAGGAMLMAMSADLLALFLALELTSLPIYALVGMRRHRPESNEALFKYFVMGAVFSAVLVYGIALTYGATGSTQLGHSVLAGRETTWWIGQALIVAGLLFKIGAVPFHFWVPDVYTGAPVAVTGFMGSVVKVGGVAALGALWLNLLAALGNTGTTNGVQDLSKVVTIVQSARDISGVGALQIVFLVAALCSLFLGNLGALKQTSARRLLAYSAIAHAGYMLLAFQLPNGENFTLGSLWFYLVAYAISGAATLAALSVISGKDDRADDLSSLAGQGRVRPFLGTVLTVFLASMAGIPVTIGFLGKFLILSDLVVKGRVLIAVFAMLMAVVGAAYYLRLIVSLWAAPSKESTHVGPTLLGRWVLALAALAVIALVTIPGWLVQTATAQ